MTVKMTEVVMRIPLPDGQETWVVFDPTVRADFAPIGLLNGAQIAQRSAPFFLKPLKENGAGAPLLHSAPLPSHEWRKSSPSGEFLGHLDDHPQAPKKTVQEELYEARGAVAFKSSQMAALDQELAPAREHEEAVRQAILATHGREGGVVVFDFAGLRERRGLFGELDAISKEWGGKRNGRKNINSEIKTLERQIQRLERIIESENRKKAKHGKDSRRSS